MTSKGVTANTAAPHLRVSKTGAMVIFHLNLLDNFEILKRENNRSSVKAEWYQTMTNTAWAAKGDTCISTLRSSESVGIVGLAPELNF